MNVGCGYKRTLSKYFKCNVNGVPYKDFDLCANCEKKFREWLNIKEIPTVKDIINKFPEYKEK